MEGWCLMQRQIEREEGGGAGGRRGGARRPGGGARRTLKGRASGGDVQTQEEERQKSLGPEGRQEAAEAQEDRGGGEEEEEEEEEEEGEGEGEGEEEEEGEEGDPADPLLLLLLLTLHQLVISGASWGPPGPEATSHTHTHRHTHTHTHRQTDRHTHTHTDPSSSMGVVCVRRWPSVVLLLLTVMLLMKMVASKESEESLEEAEEDEEEEEEAASSDALEPTSSDVSRLSPLSSWLIFRRNSNKEDNRRTKGSKRLSKHGLPGPPGPPGPQGPPGPPAPLPPQQQQLIRALQLKLRDEAAGVCVLCDRPPRVSTSFFSRLQQDVTVPRRSLVELQPFRQPDEGRSLQRGGSVSPGTGRYAAPLSGFYQLTASLFIESGDRAQVRLRDNVRAAICIESLCQSNLSVESVMGVAAAGGTFSILLTGTLYLQVGEYVSVFVDNATGSSINVQRDSLFSGILLGV